MNENPHIGLKSSILPNDVKSNLITEEDLEQWLNSVQEESEQITSHINFPHIDQVDESIEVDEVEDVIQGSSSHINLSKSVNTVV